MITTEAVEAIIRKHITATEKLGHHGSTSGHMSHIGYSLDEFTFEETEENTISIKYSYTTVVETEFTYYPDNPPYEYHYKKEMIIDKEHNIISDELLEYSDNFEIEMVAADDILFEVTVYLQKVLEKIEWNYGDNRAPFKFPPELDIINNADGADKYICIIETDFGEDDEKIGYESDSPEGLLEKVKKDIPKRFKLNFEM